MDVAVDIDRRAQGVARPGVGRSDAVLIGLFGAVVSLAFAGRPSLWLDEAATIAGSTRTLPQLFHLLGTVDGVHGLHYLLMHAWFTVVPVTEFWARVPSAVLVGGAAAGIVVLGRLLSTRSVAIAAGMAFAVLPRTTWAGVEARSYALSMFDGVWLTVLCVVAVRRNSKWLWVAYVLGLAWSTVGNVFVVLIVAAHAVLVMGLGRSRRILGAWVGSVAAATIAVTPFLFFVKTQQSQVDWIWPVGPGTVGQILGDQYFPAVYSNSARATGMETAQQITPEQVSAALHAWALVAPFIAVVLVIAVAAARMRSSSPVAGADDTRVLVRTALVWVLVPTAVVVGYSLLREPMYQPHYLSFTAPGFAVLIGVCIVVVGREPRRIAVLVAVLVAAAVPNYVAQRGPYAKFGADYSQVDELIATRAAPGECLDVDDAAPSTVTEALKAARPDAFRALRDDGQVRSAVDRGSLFEQRAPITMWRNALRTCPGLWTVSARDPALPAHEQGHDLAPGTTLGGSTAYRVPAELGFRIVERWQFNLTQVTRSTPSDDAGVVTPTR